MRSAHNTSTYGFLKTSSDWSTLNGTVLNFVHSVAFIVLARVFFSRSRAHKALIIADEVEVEVESALHLRDLVQREHSEKPRPLHA